MARESRGSSRHHSHSRTSSSRHQQPPRMPLTELTPYSREVFLDSLSYKEISKVALLNDEHYRWVRRYFDDIPILNIKVDANKFCLSRHPCFNTTHKCGHRQIRQIHGLKILIKMKLVRVKGFYIEAKRKPVSLRVMMNAVRKISGCLNELQFLYVNVNQETHYISIVEDLLRRNKSTIEGMFVCRLNEDKSRLKFRDFREISHFGVTSFPIRPTILPREKRKKQKPEKTNVIVLSSDSEEEEED